MTVIDLLRLLRRHMVLLLFTPILLAVLVIFLTRTPDFTFSSETILYTGIASGSSVEMDKSFSFFANNTAFDNLINVITSRQTQQEVAMRLLAQHLMLPDYDPRYISKKSFENLREITPAYVKSLVVKSVDQPVNSTNKSQPVTPVHTVKARKIQKNEHQTHTVKGKETLYSISRQYGVPLDQLRKMNGLDGDDITTGQTLLVDKTIIDSSDTAFEDTVASDDGSDSTSTFSFSNLSSSENRRTLPASINQAAYEQTVKNLEAYMAGSDTNFVYKLLYFTHPHYSIKAISSVNVQRIASSDLVKIKFDSDDPGICQQTLAILTEVCITNYKHIKENRTDAVVKYFEYQLKQAAGRLKIGEDKLLEFNEHNNIINYYEQSKAVAVVKEDLDVDFNNKRIKLAGYKAAISRIEEKLGTQKQVQLKSTTIIDKRNQLSEINSKITTAETIGLGKGVDDNQLLTLKHSSEKLKEELRNAVNDLYNYRNTTEGLPVSTLLNDWITNVLDYEDTKAGLEVLGDRIKEFQKQYAIYAPAGANIKRIEREISVSEQEFLEILHGLNLAKLKLQDAELSSTIKAVDPPFFPLSPNPTKRKILIIVAALVGFLIVLSSILATEYFDDTLKKPEKATKFVKLKTIGVFPKIFLKTGSLNFLFVTNRLLEMTIQQIYLLTGKKPDLNEPRTLLFLSSLSNEGKTVSAGNIAWKLKKQGRKVLFLNFSRESLHQAETSQIGYPAEPRAVSASGFNHPPMRFRFLSRLLGYDDNRIDIFSPFLQNPEHYLDSMEYLQYRVDADYTSASNYKDLLENSGLSSDYKPDFVIIEIPPILYYSFPPQLVASADLAVLVCRSNRVWSAADQGALDIFKNVTIQEPVILLNGVELQVVESVLGDLPKKRSRLRRIAKNLVRFQFYSRYQP
ncbi:MAG: LysM peptidoglycan-binding domain-containing protein [Bacteroidota bacterium]